LVLGKIFNEIGFNQIQDGLFKKRTYAILVTKEVKFANKIIRLNYDIPIGATGGITRNVIAFITSSLIESLPVIGTLL
jgi:hypothetical protein